MNTAILVLTIAASSITVAQNGAALVQQLKHVGNKAKHGIVHVVTLGRK